MAHSYHHAESSAKRWGGTPEDYLPIHNWFDETKSSWADVRHRALRHHSFGVFECENKFGVTITNSNGRQVPVRLVAEQHVIEDLGRIPSVQDWLRDLPTSSWMYKNAKPKAGVTGNLDDIPEKVNEHA